MGETTARRIRARPSRAMLLRSLVLPVGAAIVLVFGYFQVLPLDGTDQERNLSLLALWLVVLAVVIAIQTRQIMSAEFPLLRAVAVLAVVLPAYLVAFSIGYYLMAGHGTGSFGGPLSRMGALYFTVTVFATVGFGDIHAQDDTAMAVVTVQMILNLLLLAVGVRAVIAAARLGHERRAVPTDADAPDT